MSYYVIYNPELAKKYPALQKQRKNVGIRWIVASVIAVALLGCLNRNEVREFLIPGDSAVTVQATEELLKQVKAGAPLMDAFAVFCETVVSGEI